MEFIIRLSKEGFENLFFIHILSVHPYILRDDLSDLSETSHVTENWNTLIHSFIHQWLYSPLLGPGLFFSFVIFFTQTVGLLGRAAVFGFPEAAVSKLWIRHTSVMEKPYISETQSLSNNVGFFSESSKSRKVSLVLLFCVS
jgi:hypothetical protein